MRRLGFIHDIDGNRSSKRLIAFVAMECVVVSTFAGISGHVIPDYMFNGLVDIVMFGLGAVLGERITRKKEDPPA